MENKPTSRVVRVLPHLPAHWQFLSVAALFVLFILFWLEGVIMGGKSKAPGFLLLLISVAYVVLALTLFDKYPGVVFALGFAWGAVLIGTFLISVFTRGRNDKNK